MICIWASRCLFFRSSGITTSPGISIITFSASLAAIIKELVAAKSVANRRPRYVKGLRQYLTLFAKGRETMPLAAISVTEIESWFATRAEAPSTRASNLGRLSALFSFAVRRGYLMENPVDRIETVFLEAKPPRILTPAEARRMLEFTRIEMPRFMRWLALALFAGVRPEELDKFDGGIDLERALVTIDAAASKVRRRRVMPLPAAAVAWLKLGGDLPLPQSTRRRYVRRIRDYMNWREWPQDVLRHTAASYLLTEHQDAGKVALWLGNSPKILLAHYHEITSKQAAQEFYSIRPAVAQLNLDL
jgi:site-specific recombinase XerD